MSITFILREVSGVAAREVFPVKSEAAFEGRQPGLTTLNQPQSPRGEVGKRSRSAAITRRRAPFTCEPCNSKKNRLMCSLGEAVFSSKRTGGIEPA
jgi:hypothetical protein